MVGYVGLVFFALAAILRCIGWAIHNSTDASELVDQVSSDPTASDIINAAWDCMSAAFVISSFRCVFPSIHHTLTPPSSPHFPCPTVSTCLSPLSYPHVPVPSRRAAHPRVIVP